MLRFEQRKNRPLLASNCVIGALRSNKGPRECTGCGMGFWGLVAFVKLIVLNAGFALRGGGR